MALNPDPAGASAAPGTSSEPVPWRVGAGQLAAWGFSFLLLRVFAVSGYDWDTAFLVSTTLGLDDGLVLLVGSLMASYQLTAVLLACLVPLLVAAAVWGVGRHRVVMTAFAALGLALLASLTVSHRLWWLPVTTTLVLAAFVLVRRLPPTNWARRTLTRALARVGLMVGAATLLVAVFVQTPWLPQERIQTTHGTITGYVLSVDSGYLNVLTEDHEFKILLSGDVTERE